MDETRLAFGRLLAAQMEAQGIAQTVLGRRLGVKQPMISAWARGRKRPNPANCDRIAEALALDVDEVLTQAGYRPRLVTDDEPEIRNIVEMLRRIPPDRYPAITDYIRWQYDRARQQRVVRSTSNC